MSYANTVSEIQELSFAEVDEVNGALTYAQYLAYTAIGIGAVVVGTATGGIGLIFVGGLLIAVTDKVA